MENQNQNYKEKIPLVKRSRSFRMIIPEEVENKIRFVCQQVWQDEWSGTLFYKHEGSFEDGTLTIRCVDIYVMDIGTSGYTEFDMSPDVISYMATNQELLDCQLGLIHSHNLMDTFFSATDVNTLREEGSDRNHFVSLIVNNRGTYTAAITRKIKSKNDIVKEISYLSFGGDLIHSNDKTVLETEELEWFLLKVEFERDNSFHEEFKSRFNEISRAKEAKKRYNPYGSNHKGNWQEPSLRYIDKLPRKLEEQEIQTLIPFKEEGISKQNIKNNELPFDRDNNSEENLDYERFEFDKQVIKSLVLQLITGSIILPNESKIDASKWSRSMVPLFRNRFGADKEGLDNFRNWAESYIEYICLYTDDADLAKYLDYDEMAAVCAKDIIRELSKLPTNEYIEIYINILENYLI